MSTWDDTNSCILHLTRVPLMKRNVLHLGFVSRFAQTLILGVSNTSVFFVSLRTAVCSSLNRVCYRSTALNTFFNSATTILLSIRVLLLKGVLFVSINRYLFLLSKSYSRSLGTVK
ncbi:hypothetical protein YC2023_049373 [Brassica napus]